MKQKSLHDDNRGSCIGRYKGCDTLGCTFIDGTPRVGWTCYPEYADSWFLCNVDTYLEKCKASCPRRPWSI